MSNNQKSWQELFKRAIKLHDQGIEGNDQAVKKAHQLLKEVRALAPENNLIEAYYGSTVALLGRDENLDPIERIEYAEEGLSLLDQVVDKSPNDEDIRTLRGYVCLKIPDDIFGRTETAVKDFNYLINAYESNKTSITKKLYDKLLFDLGNAYQTMGKTKKANKTWVKLLNTTSEKKRYEKLLEQEGVQLDELK
ncbi:hypothetical protein E3U55_08580 [Filobacillus milosensis]|uniref:Tetratricopeptide repeat protein n=1 Tax=Filobacillus milosensis TaxID=94137 RepID=A0A4Y8IME1_9BACI|nr:hypothetical protein [Filobacillus milosensis]TFB21361.1 hypothetical protein E3U55_08580 [Filobacillus milosensis]